LRILVDVDEVLNNLIEAWVAYLNERHGLRAEAEKITLWDLSCIFPTLTEDEIISPLAEDSFWNGTAVREHSVETVEQMIMDGHEVYIVTAHFPYHSIPAKIDWLLANYPCLTWDNVIVTRRKQLLKADVLIDDGVHNLEGGDYFKILIDSPYNRGYDAEGNGMVRAYSLREAYEIVKERMVKP
jgi:5'(3')-deoxyribonucleotidase